MADRKLESLFAMPPAIPDTVSSPRSKASSAQPTQTIIRMRRVSLRPWHLSPGSESVKPMRTWTV
eukprot:2567140-Rhodomonas_salina.1